jgi:hypothetical protein
VYLLQLVANKIKVIAIENKKIKNKYCTLSFFITYVLGYKDITNILYYQIYFVNDLLKELTFKHVFPGLRYLFGTCNTVEILPNKFHLNIYGDPGYSPLNIKKAPTFVGALSIFHNQNYTNSFSFSV